MSPREVERGVILVITSRVIIMTNACTNVHMYGERKLGEELV